MTGTDCTSRTPAALVQHWCSTSVVLAQHQCSTTAVPRCCDISEVPVLQNPMATSVQLRSRGAHDGANFSTTFAPDMPRGGPRLDLFRMPKRSIPPTSFVPKGWLRGQPDCVGAASALHMSCTDARALHARARMAGTSPRGVPCSDPSTAAGATSTATLRALPIRSRIGGDPGGRGQSRPCKPWTQLPSPELAPPGRVGR